VACADRYRVEGADREWLRTLGRLEGEAVVARRELEAFQSSSVLRRRWSEVEWRRRLRALVHRRVETALSVARHTGDHGEVRRLHQVADVLGVRR
jgi:hypothetical protein